MKTNDLGNDFQTRREFFKKAAQAVLLVVGAVVLSSLPVVKSEAATGCKHYCSDSCSSGCAVQVQVNA